MEVTTPQLRACARSALEQRGFSVELITGAGIVPGVQLRATKGSDQINVAVRTALNRNVGLVRSSDGSWKTIPSVNEVLIVVPSTDDESAAEVFGFDPKVLMKIFDAALAAQLKRMPKLSDKAPIFVPLYNRELEKGQAKETVSATSGLKTKALWSLVLPIPSAASLEHRQAGADTGFIERVKREFAKLNGVDVSKVRVNFFIDA
jgi:hypothetical protein